MSAFQIAGLSITIDGDNGSGTLEVTDTINPITGGMGANTVRILNDGSNNATITFTPTDATYNFADVAWTTDSANGANALFNVTVTNSGYQVAIIDGGEDFAASDTITVLGTELGGTTTANDLVMTVGTVDAGVITSVTLSGTYLWPQSIAGEFTMLPNSIEFVQVTQTPSIGCYFTANNGDSGNVFVTPVTII